MKTPLPEVAVHTPLHCPVFTWPSTARGENLGQVVIFGFSWSRL